MQSFVSTLLGWFQDPLVCSLAGLAVGALLASLIVWLVMWRQVLSRVGKEEYEALEDQLRIKSLALMENSEKVAQLEREKALLRDAGSRVTQLEARIEQQIQMLLQLAHSIEREVGLTVTLPAEGADPENALAIHQALLTQLKESLRSEINQRRSLEDKAQGMEKELQEKDRELQGLRQDLADHQSVLADLETQLRRQGKQLTEKLKERTQHIPGEARASFDKLVSDPLHRRLDELKARTSLLSKEARQRVDQLVTERLLKPVKELKEKSQKLTEEAKHSLDRLAKQSS